MKSDCLVCRDTCDAGKDAGKDAGRNKSVALAAIQPITAMAHSDLSPRSKINGESQTVIAAARRIASRDWAAVCPATRNEADQATSRHESIGVSTSRTANRQTSST